MDAADLPPDERVAKIEEHLQSAPSFTGAFEEAADTPSDTSADRGLSAFRESFDNIDLTTKLPAMLKRSDGETIFYAGKINTIYGPAGTGKTWAALITVLEYIQQTGANALWIDYEDGKVTFMRRSMMIAFDPREYENEFAFIKPDMFSDALAIKEAKDFLNSGQGAGMVVIDSASAAHCPSDGADVGWWFEKYVHPWTEDGHGVLIVDHVPKTTVDRPRGPIGSQAKLARITGAALAVSGVAWTKRMPGRIFLTNHKDRGGDLPAAAGKVVAVIEGSYRQFGEELAFSYDVIPPDENDNVEDLSMSILRGVADAGEVKGMRRMREMFTGGSKRIGDTVDNLVHTGLLEKDASSKTHVYTVSDSGLHLLSGSEE